MSPVKSVAVIGCGPAGAITIDALVQEGVFERITVFERRERPGGCWIPDTEGHVQQLPDLKTLSARTADRPLEIPAHLPAWTPRCTEYRFSDTSIYPMLETNIAADAMEFSQEPFPKEKSAWSVERHGPDTPFRHHDSVQRYIECLVNRKDYPKLVQFNTTVEQAEKVGRHGSWRLILRKPIGDQDYWWAEEFDAVINASGHYSVPFIPDVEGLHEYRNVNPDGIEHSKSFRDPERYREKRVVTVGASISGPDIAAMLAGVTETPLRSVVRGKYHPYFGDWAFRHPCIQRHPPISCIRGRTIYLENGNSIPDVDHIIFGTGYSWTEHFLPGVTIRNNRLPGLYQHVFPMWTTNLLFVGAVAAGFTFKVFEWQAVLAARYLAGRVKLPPIEEQREWERARIREKGDGVPFTALYPEFQEYFEEVRAMAGEPRGRKGRRLPPFDPKWRETFDAAHLKRIAMWKEQNRKAEEELRDMYGVNGAT